MTDRDKLREALEKLDVKARLIDDDIRYYSGGSKKNPAADELTALVRDNLPTILAALASKPAPSTKSAQDESAWLIEDKAAGFTHYVGLPGKRSNWFGSTGRGEDREYRTPVELRKDASLALRFARKEDAEAFITAFDRFLLNPSPAEHMWPANCAALATPTALDPATPDQAVMDERDRALERAAQLAEDGYRCRTCEAVFTNKEGHPNNECRWPSWDGLLPHQVAAAIRGEPK